MYHLEIHFVIRSNEDKLYMTHADVRAQRTELTFATQVCARLQGHKCAPRLPQIDSLADDCLLRVQAEIDEGTDVVADQIYDIIDRASG